MVSFYNGYCQGKTQSAMIMMLADQLGFPWNLLGRENEVSCPTCSIWACDAAHRDCDSRITYEANRRASCGLLT
jgi:hypothetical protein